MLSKPTKSHNKGLRCCSAKVEGGLRFRREFEKRSEPDKPLISVITVVRNGEKTLERTIESVLNQTYKNIEYIIIDGFSKDGTLDIIRSYDSKIDYWISEPDRSLYDAMNKGVHLSSGKWINFMNAGDTFYSQEALSHFIENIDNSTDLIYGHCHIIFGSDLSVIWKAGNICNLWKGMVFRHQSLLTRASIMKRIPFEVSYSISGDFAFIYSCYQKNYRFRFIDTIIASVQCGGISDKNLALGIRENHRAVSVYHPSIKVDLYYAWMLFLLYGKRIIKSFMSRRIINKIRLFKYR